jgi:hypothetical protein
MKKLPIVLCAVLAAGIASPASADIQYNPLPPWDAQIGITNPTMPGLFSVYVTSGDPLNGPMISDTFQFTFALHVDRGVNYWTDRLHFSFVYDNNSLEVLNAYPVGPWDGGNYEGLQWPNTSHGIIGVVSLSNFVSPFTEILPGEIVPFFHVTLHVKSATYSQVNPFGITVPGYGPLEGYGMTLFSTLGPVYDVTPEQWIYGGGAIHEVPEPASMMLLGGSLAAMAGGWIRRKRRA